MRLGKTLAQKWLDDVNFELRNAVFNVYAAVIDSGLSRKYPWRALLGLVTTSWHETADYKPANHGAITAL